MILNLFEKSINNDFSNPKMFMFETDSKNFKITYDLINPVEGNFPHVGITAREGICVLYYSPVEKTWLNVDVYTRNSPVNVLMSHMVDEGQKYKIMIYGPILSEINQLYIEIPDGNFSRIINNYWDIEVSFFGGIHTFGIGCTTVGLMFSNILSRKLNFKSYNIAFNSPNYLNQIYDFFKEDKSIPHSKIAILELDYYNQNDDIIRKYLKDVVNLLNKHYPIVIGWFSIPPKKSYKQENIYELLKEEIYEKKIIIEDYSFLYDEEYFDMCTFGFNFINDAGNIMIFKRLKEVLGELKWNI